tara:strand:- start:1119 stop:1565 length:447 start_codon:yes stop_codon:yes gene_type:complete
MGLFRSGLKELCPAISRGWGKINAELCGHLVICGLNLNASKGRHVQIGQAVLEIIGICAPCSRMEAALGKGVYSAMRGHGGWYAAVVMSERIKTSDTVTPLPATPNPESGGYLINRVPYWDKIGDITCQSMKNQSNSCSPSCYSDRNL